MQLGEVGGEGRVVELAAGEPDVEPPERAGGGPSGVRADGGPRPGGARSPAARPIAVSSGSVLAGQSFMLTVIIGKNICPKNARESTTSAATTFSELSRLGRSLGQIPASAPSSGRSTRTGTRSMLLVEPVVIRPLLGSSGKRRRPSAELERAEATKSSRADETADEAERQLRGIPREHLVHTRSSWCCSRIAGARATSWRRAA